MTQGDLFRTLADAREEYRHGLSEGVHCPCCDRFGKIYRRRLGASMVKALVLIHRFFAETTNPRAWLHVADYLHDHPEATAATRGDFGKLRYWGFLRRHPDGGPRWRITGDGSAFALGLRPAPPWVGEYRRECVAVAPPSDGLVYIGDVVGDRFDYDRLMSEPVWIENTDARQIDVEAYCEGKQ